MLSLRMCPLSAYFAYPLYLTVKMGMRPQQTALTLAKKLLKSFGDLVANPIQPNFKRYGQSCKLRPAKKNLTGFQN